MDLTWHRDRLYDNQTGHHLTIVLAGREAAAPHGDGGGAGEAAAAADHQTEGGGGQAGRQHRGNMRRGQNTVIRYM